MSWTLLIAPITAIIDKLIPDSDAANKAKAELLSMQAKGELDAQLGQIQTNIEQAKHPNILVSGARPFILWTCGIAFAYATVVEPFARFAAVVWFNYTGAFPVINTDLTMQAMFAILGLSGYRAIEKVRGVASK